MPMRVLRPTIHGDPTMRTPSWFLATALFLALAGGGKPALAADPITLFADLTEAPRRIIHARLRIPGSPGSVALIYPKWIPGEHGPTGPIANLAGPLTITSNGKTVPWRRDDVEMYAIHVSVPGGAKSLELSLDFLLSGEEEGFTFGASSTPNLAVLNWNQVLLYPTGVPLERLIYSASLRLPAGWKYGTALPVARESGGIVEFKPAPIVTLIDSPVIAGRYFRTIALAPEITPRHLIHVAADSPEAIEMPREVEEHYSQLVREAGATFVSRHYREYHCLYTLSDHVSFFGLEHHESSDDRVKERTLIDEDQRLRSADLLPHEFVHSWNGKYRRPADLATPNYEVPMKTDLLWVYEGLTEYLGWLLEHERGPALRLAQVFQRTCHGGQAARAPGRYRAGRVEAHLCRLPFGVSEKSRDGQEAGRPTLLPRALSHGRGGDSGSPAQEPGREGGPRPGDEGDRGERPEMDSEGHP